MNTLSDRLKEHVQACFTGLWVQTWESEDALAEIGQLCRQEQWTLHVWNMADGLNGDGNGDPVAAISAMAATATASESGATLLVIGNAHRILAAADVVAHVERAIKAGKQSRSFLVFLSPVVELPVELQKQVIVLEHELPTRQQLDELARSIATEPGDLPDDMGPVLDASVGLTRFEAEGAYSLALVRHGKIEPSTLWELKTAAVKKSGVMDLYRGGERFADLGGLDNLKQFATRALHTKSTLARPRGLMLLGVPGTGKSAFAKALGNETGRPTLSLSSERIKTSGYGDSEQRLARCLALADAMAPCVFFVDEIEGLLAGANRAGDPGVTKSLGKVLSIWLNDHTSDVFVICTSNDVSELPVEFTRAERFDGVFFLDTPSEAERDAIWGMYLKQFGINEQERPNDAGWTGAEIKACCRLATLLDVSLAEAALNVVPVSVTAAERLTALRSWASGRCLDASRPGIYEKQAPPDPRRRRVVKPSAN